MQKVKQFLENIFSKEADAYDLIIYKDKVDEYNTFIDQEINAHCQPYFDKEMNEVTSFNLLGHISAFSDSFYKESIEYYEKQIPRYIFKISEYLHERFGSIWACYVSIYNPSETIKKISDCFIIAEIEGKLKFISKMGVEPDTKKWKHYLGDDHLDLRLGNLGKPTKIERYTEPVSKDDWSLKEYLKDQ